MTDSLRSLTLVRHGDTDYTMSGRYQGHRDEPLNAIGIQQARALQTRLPDALGNSLSGTAIYVSDLQRARETARLALPGYTAQVDARLRELNFGIFEGFTAAENDARGPAFAAWLNDPENNAPPDGESLRLLAARLGAWLKELEAQSTIAFTHGGAIRMLIALVTTTPFLRLRGLTIAPTDVVRLRLDEQRRCTLDSLEWQRCPPAAEVQHD